MPNPFTYILCLTVLILAGCKPGSPTPPPAPAASQAQATNIDERRALEIAKAKVKEMEAWADRATYEAQPGDDGWVVRVWRGSRSATGRRTVKIDKNGDVVEYVKVD